MSREDLIDVHSTLVHGKSTDSIQYTVYKNTIVKWFRMISGYWVRATLPMRIAVYH